MNVELQIVPKPKPIGATNTGSIAQLHLQA